MRNSDTQNPNSDLLEGDLSENWLPDPIDAVPLTSNAMQLRTVGTSVVRVMVSR